MKTSEEKKVVEKTSKKVEKTTKKKNKNKKVEKNSRVIDESYVKYSKRFGIPIPDLIAMIEGRMPIDQRIIDSWDITIYDMV